MENNISQNLDIKDEAANKEQNHIHETNNQEEKNLKLDMFQQSNLFIKQNKEDENEFPAKKHILDDEAEYKHLKEVVSAFLNYAVNLLY